MARKELTKEQVKLLLPLTRDVCAMHDIAPVCADYKLVQGDHFFGEFAHICAAERGGERFVEEMDDTARNSVENIIVLCPNHHTIIDKKGNSYSAEQLRDIKARHEGQDEAILEVPESVVDEAVAIANINITSTNNNGSGVQQVSTVTGTAPQTTYSAARDIYIMGVPTPLVPPVPTSRPATGFYQPDQTLAMTIEATWLRIPDDPDVPTSGFDAEYILFVLNGKRFVVLAQELTEQTVNAPMDGMGKYNMEAANIATILQSAQQTSATGLQEHTLLQELQALSSETSVRVVIDTNEANVQLLPFEKLDGDSAQCANPIKLMLRGVLR